jgi:hypothetical protein
MSRKGRRRRKEPHPGRVRFYADEDVPKHLIEYLRERHKVNITSAKEMGYQGRDDRFHFQEAEKQARFLLTCDKDFLDHSRFPFRRMVGVVILDIPKESPGLGWMSLWLESEIVPSGRGIMGTKIVVHHDRFDFYFVDERGIVKKQVVRLRERETESA